MFAPQYNKISTSVGFSCKYSKRRHVYTVINISTSTPTCYTDLKLSRLLSGGSGHSKHVRSKGVYFKVRHHFAHQKCYVLKTIELTFSVQNMAPGCSNNG